MSDNIYHKKINEMRKKINKDKNNNNNGNNGNTLCEMFADILDSMILPSPEEVCVVTRQRDIDATIKGRPTVSPLAINALFSFEDLDEEGNALNLGETVILENEINIFISLLRALGLKVTALHNHWLFDDPRLFYIHWLSVEDPLDFAEKTAIAFSVLEDFDNDDLL